MVLEYLREYRTYFRISQSYGVGESTAYKTVKLVEDTFIKHPHFALPGKHVFCFREPLLVFSGIAVSRFPFNFIPEGGQNISAVLLDF
jgi:hypothetical protein